MAWGRVRRNLKHHIEEIVKRAFIFHFCNRSNEDQNKNLSNFKISCIVNIIILGEEKLDKIMISM